MDKADFVKLSLANAHAGTAGRTKWADSVGFEPLPPFGSLSSDLARLYMRQHAKFVDVSVLPASSVPSLTCFCCPQGHADAGRACNSESGNECGLEREQPEAAQLRNVTQERRATFAHCRCRSHAALLRCSGIHQCRSSAKQQRSYWHAGAVRVPSPPAQRAFHRHRCGVWR